MDVLLIKFVTIPMYIGPGLGGGTILAILGILTSFFLSLIAIFWYPLKRLFRFLKSKFKK